MNATLILGPSQSSFIDIFKAFRYGKPLSPDQFNRLTRYATKLSQTRNFDTLLRYYGIFRNYIKEFTGVLSLKEIPLTKDGVDGLKVFLQQLLIYSHRSINVELSMQQFVKLKFLTYNDLIFLHGNQLLTGAPFMQGSIPPVNFFQWGNLFGVVKYQELPGEKIIKGNVLIYFEDKQDRKISQFISDYYSRSQPQLILRNQPSVQANKDEVFESKVIKPPRLIYQK